MPNKNAGFIILLTSIFTFFFFGEIRNLTTLCLLNNNGFSLSSFFSSFCSLLWLGAQFPIEKFLSYGRIFTLHYYFLLMCILFLPLSFFLFKSSWIFKFQFSGDGVSFINAFPFLLFLETVEKIFILFLILFSHWEQLLINLNTFPWRI